MFRIQEVDEAVAHVALVLEVDRQIEEVVGAFVADIDLLEQHLLLVLVRNITHL